MVPLVPTGASPLHLLAAAAGGAALMLLVIFGLRRCSSGRSKVGSAGGGANLVPVLLVQGAGNFGDIRLANPEACYDSGQWDTMTEKRTKRKKMKRTDLERGNGGPALMHGGNNKYDAMLAKPGLSDAQRASVLKVQARGAKVSRPRTSPLPFDDHK